MPSEVMDQRRHSPLHAAASSSPFSREIRFPAAERQVGFWKSESTPDCGVDALFGPKFGTERAGLSIISPKAPIHDSENLSGAFLRSVSLQAKEAKVSPYSIPNQSASFASSLQEASNGNVASSLTSGSFCHSVDAPDSYIEEVEPFDNLEEIEAQTIGDLLPDDDELFSGAINDAEHIPLPNGSDDQEEDLFCSVGGLEIEREDGVGANGGGLPPFECGSVGSFAGEHPFGEHPSRTLFVRNINSNVEDAELKSLFEKYGDIRALYTACKHRGFVMISYYDIRAACNAMRALQSMPLRRRKLDIHFSIPKDNPSERDINQGTLAAFNVDPSVTNNVLYEIFGAFGEIKEIRETPQNFQSRFIEFYDVRASEAALRALSGIEISGKRIKLEPCPPGGGRQSSLMQQLLPDLDHEVSNGCFQRGSPPCNPLLSRSYGDIPDRRSSLGANSNGVIAADGVANGFVRSLNLVSQAPIGSPIDRRSNGISSTIPHNLSSPIRVNSIGNPASQIGAGELSNSLGQINLGAHFGANFHPHSLPEYANGIAHGIPCNLPNTMSTLDENIGRLNKGIDNNHMQRITSAGLSSSPSFKHNGAFGSPATMGCPIHGHQSVWNNTNGCNQVSGSTMWHNSPPLIKDMHGHSSIMHGFQGSPTHVMNTMAPIPHHHVGSAPSINPTPWDRRRAYLGEPQEAPFNPGSLGSMPPVHLSELTSHNFFARVGSGNHMEPPNSLHVGLPSPQQRFHMFHARNNMIPMAATYDLPYDRIRSRRNDTTTNQTDNKKQYELDLERIMHGEDSRTTLMIKNIPNKYTSKMLLAAIDEQHRGTYDFIYLPIDFKNKCNVGYAFINLIDPQKIIPFHKTFDGKKWEKFNSEKVASLAYARIQGKAALVAHFQNSSLMNEDKRCRPILFCSDGPNAGDPEPFPMGVNIRSRNGKTRNQNNSEDSHEGSPDSSIGDETSKALGSSPASKDF